jgi:Domain of unknown function (DUF4383)
VTRPGLVAVSTSPAHIAVDRGYLWLFGTTSTDERACDMTTTQGRTTGRLTASPAQTVATVVALTFLVVGILGFIPGITTHYGDMSFAGHESDAQLLGIFEVSVLHNIVHLLFGVAGLALSRTPNGAVGFLIGGGLIYLVLWLYGLVVDKASSANFVPMDSADDWLHFALGVVMVAAGIALRGRASRATTR